MSRESRNATRALSGPRIPFASGAPGRVLALLLVLVSAAGCEELTSALEKAETLNWTGRYATSSRNLAWASQRDLTSSQFGTAFNDYANRGYIIINTGARNVGGSVRYSMVWRENFENRDWSQERHMTSTQYEQKDGDMEAQGFRPLDVEGYQLDGVLRFSGIWIQNREDIEWWSELDMTVPEYEQHSEDQEVAGLRPIDLEIYPTSSGPRIGAIWNENVHDLDWIQRSHMTRTEYQQEVDQQSAAGYRMIDFESYEILGNPYYAAIWEKPRESFAAAVRTNRSSREFANLWRQYRDEGYRIVDLEQYEVNGSERFGGIWIENADRFRYQHKGALNQEVSLYRDTANSGNGVMGVSVAIIEDGEMVYRRGFGWADEAANKVAHGQTVYLLASISKVIGGTLAARLASEGRLVDGTTFNFDLGDSTKAYLTNIPSSGGHDHTLEQLTSHLGCVNHYPCGSNPTSTSGRCTWPGIADQTMHYGTAQAAAASIWSTPPLDSARSGTTVQLRGCTIGTDWSYSTPAFTLLGAAMEVATGRTVDQLVEDELAEPFGLPSMRAQYASATLPSNYERAVGHNSGGTALNPADNSWKVFGGGIEASAVDLARFGWKVLNAEIVDEATRDAALFSPVACTNRGFGQCRYGVSWRLDRRNSRDFAEHGGDGRGVRTHLRIYEDEGLVIAVLTNQKGNSPRLLVNALETVILP